MICLIEKFIFGDAFTGSLECKVNNEIAIAGKKNWHLAQAGWTLVSMALVLGPLVEGKSHYNTLKLQLINCARHAYS